VLDRAYAELLTSVERRSGDPNYLQRLLPRLDPSASPLVQKAFQEWRSSPSLALQTAAMRSLISSGDTEALLQVRSELESPSSSVSRTLGGALWAFRSTDPVAIKILGELAISSNPPLETRQSAASALYALHTKDTLPYLVQLLDSSDKILRVDAISGLSAFALHMRMIGASGVGSDALDEVMNPARRRKIPDAAAPFDTDETRQNVHFGFFRDDREEFRYLNYWKSWFQRNRSRIGI
jgi:HEAT repeat protein